MVKQKKRPSKKTPVQKKRKRKTDKKLLQKIIRIILIVVVVAVIIFFFVFGRGDTISLPENAIGTLLTPVQNAVTTVTDGVRGFVSRWRNYDKLEDDYNTLALENQQLKLELNSAEEATQENSRLKSLLDARDTYSSLDPIYAKVIARDSGTWFETFSINRGTSDGIAVGMAVVNGDGLIGRVYTVGLTYAKVITVIDSRSAVACLVQRTRDNGIMRGQISASDSVAECYIYYLPNINNVTPGDVVVTSGTDSLYPKGLKIGSVSAVSLDSGSDGTYAVVSPSVDFQRIEEVFVLRTVIETDKDTLPAVEFATAAPSATPTIVPGLSTTPTPEPTTGAEQYWTRPTNEPTNGTSAGYYVSELIEDTWANEE